MNVLQNYVPTPQFFENGQAIQKEAVVDLLLARLRNVDEVIRQMKKAEAMALGGMDWKVCDTVVGPITCRVLKRGEIHKDGSPMSDPVEPPAMTPRRQITVEKWQEGLRPIMGEKGEIAASGGLKGEQS